MEAGRGHLRTAPPHARFRCLVCRMFVVGTAAGHCPRCGYVPPTAPAVPPARPAWPYLPVIVGLLLGAALFALLR